MHDVDGEVLHTAERWRSAGRGVALATLVGAWGSAPRPVGSLMAVDEAGAFTGSICAGCVEAAVMTAALAVIAEGVPRLLEFGVSDDMALNVGLSCGGRVRVFVERID